MKKNAIWNKNSKRHVSKGHRTGSRRRYKSMVCYQDDIFMGATNENKSIKKTDIVLNRLGNTGMTINEINA